MRVRTYAPGPGWVPAAYAAAVMVAYYVVGPLVARFLIALDDIHADYPTTD